MKQLNPKEINTTALAYIGDAVYEIYVREHVLGQDLSGMDKNFGAHVDALHKRAIRYVRADGQAKAVKAMLNEGFLSDEEAALVRRARNHKTASKPKNADAMDYKYATAFEALIGFWHLSAQAGGDGSAEAKQRMEEIIFKAFERIET
ncbi:MAG: ribonuclease III [Firmicutes bacterium]|nr:ribonuclease III [Bacillota bacterium]